MQEISPLEKKFSPKYSTESTKAMENKTSKILDFPELSISKLQMKITKRPTQLPL
jgi:hypothetical protein